MQAMTALGIAARWLQLVASLALVGATAVMLLAGRSDRPTARAWQVRLVAASRGLAVLALAGGVIGLAAQTALLEGRTEAAVDWSSLWRVAIETQAGHVWLARQGLMALLLLFLLLLRADLREPLDWTAARGETLLLASLAAAFLSLAGHAAAAESRAGLAVANSAVHLLAAGVWIGGLWPLAALLRRASASEGSDARAYAVLAVRRFSAAALAAVLVLAVSGAINAALYVGDLPGLLGTDYGRLLLVKLAILVPALGIAWLNRRTLPALSGNADAVGRPAMRRLATFMAVEGALALLLIAVVALLVSTPPARHQAPSWPLSFRLSTIVLGDAPSLQARVLVGSQVAVLGAATALCSLTWRRLGAPILAGAVLLLAGGLGLALPPLAIDAYPLTYRRPSVAYTAASITAGEGLYGQHCAGCHGATGAGDGPAGLRLPRPPADFRAAHTMHHTAGDLYWWISHGIPGSGMPGFGDRLSEDERWDLVNFVRALAAANTARQLGPELDAEAPRVVAPDATFAVGPTPLRSLRDYRGRKVVLLVLYTLPGARPRLSELAEAYGQLVVLGMEVIAVPRDADPDAIRQLGPVPPIWFPVVTEGARDIVAAYSLFSRAPTAEFLIDRQGYLRAISAGERGWPDVGALLSLLQQLNAEKAAVAEPDEHVH
jgi:putative copper resistance protein D